MHALERINNEKSDLPFQFVRLVGQFLMSKEDFPKPDEGPDEEKSDPDRLGGLQNVPGHQDSMLGKGMGEGRMELEAERWSPLWQHPLSPYPSTETPKYLKKSKSLSGSDSGP